MTLLGSDRLPAQHVLAAPSFDYLHKASVDGVEGESLRQFRGPSRDLRPQRCAPLHVITM